MKRRFLILTVLFLLFARHLGADNQFIVRLDSGLSGIQPICIGLGCTVTRGLDGTLGQLFLVNVPSSIDPNAFLQLLQSQPGVSNVELDTAITVPAAHRQPDSQWTIGFTAGFLLRENCLEWLREPTRLPGDWPK